MQDESEATPVTIALRPNGSYRVEGLEELRDWTGTRLETREKIALCRCGRSATKPFCDAAHKAVGFDSSGPNEVEGGSGLTESEEPCVITVGENGPYEVTGRVRLLGVETGEWMTAGRFWLCRCGGSQNKPFCDGTHRKIGFTDPGS